MNDVVGVILAAGIGSRMLPLSLVKPKALFPVNNVPLVDLAISQLGAFTSEISVNAFHHLDQMQSHLDGRVNLSVETELLGGAGALGKLKSWIDNRDVIVMNADAYFDTQLPNVFTSSDQVQLLVQEAAEKPDFANKKYLGVSRIPWQIIKRLHDSPTSLWTEVLEPSIAQDRADFVNFAGGFFECGTPSQYLQANLHAAGAQNVVGDDAEVEGIIDRCVIWPRGKVRQHESLFECVRAEDDVTLDCSGPNH